MPRCGGAVVPGEVGLATDEAWSAAWRAVNAGIYRAAVVDVVAPAWRGLVTLLLLQAVARLELVQRRHNHHGHHGGDHGERVRRSAAAVIVVEVHVGGGDGARTPDVLDVRVYHKQHRAGY
mmetsp:Transcript_17829/g.43883  ORF Transcript_17829/g.43883 Transcript_17829/m.43883 type:complete len:121 (+) Transcript_17829:113-475(+)